MTESNGPDRFNMTPGCKSHHEGVRTGIKDYCCCCDPCNYVRFEQGATLPPDRICCRCMPKMLVVKYSATNADACCRDAILPMYGSLWNDDNQQQVMRYTGSIVGHPVTVYISNESVEDSSGYNTSDSLGCRWTIRIPSLGIDEEVEIDHTTVTCLGVPAISITGVTAFDSCVGTISLLNYETAKVPFQQRVFPDSFYDGEELSIQIPDGFGCDVCTEVPRFICMAGRRHVGGDSEWVEFVWDTDFESYIDYDSGEDIIGVWIYTPDSPLSPTESLYLISDVDGICWIQFDLESPFGLNTASEEFARIQLTECGCDFKYLSIQPIAQPTTGFPLGIDLRTGRCSCWDYWCGTCRCVPQYLCGYVFIDDVFYKEILFTWDVVTKSWISSGGTDPDGNAMSFTLSVSLESDGEGGCQISTSYSDYDINPVKIECGGIISGEFSGTNVANDGYFSLSVNTSFTGECQTLISCATATPCTDDCGDHPPVLYATLHGWSDSTAGDEPGFDTISCTVNITLVYWSQVLSTGGSSIEINCGYVGYSLVASTFAGSPVTYLIKATLDSGTLEIIRKLTTDLSGPGEVTDIILDSETCPPYVGRYFEVTGISDCFFGDPNTTIQRYEVDIIE